MANRIDAVVQIIKTQREASRLCSEMARDTAESPEGHDEFAEMGEEIDSGYETALDEIEEGHWADALVTLEGVRSLEHDGGDDQHASRSIEALKSMLSESTAT